MDKKNTAKEATEQTTPNKPAYKAPRIVEAGTVEELTHGSREQTSDEPGSGYRGG